MAIAEIAQKYPTKAKKGPDCYVCAALRDIPESEADALRRLLADPTRRYSEISEQLADDPDTPLDLAPQSLSRHARGKCAARERLR